MTRLTRSFAILATLFLAVIPAVAANPATRSLETLGIRADRFFDQKEWASASAMYSLMIDQRPDSAALYGRAITAAGMRNDTTEQRMLLKMALRSKVPLDSLFSSVQHASFALGQSHLLEHFLIMSARTEPWMERKIDSSLLAYYAFRRNGAQMIHYAGKLLKGVPDNEQFGLRLAEGLLIEGRTAEATEAFTEVLRHHPQSLTALLYLGEISMAAGDTAAAHDYLSRARAIDSTPRLDALLTPPEAHKMHK